MLFAKLFKHISAAAGATLGIMLALLITTWLPILSAAQQGVYLGRCMTTPGDQ